MALTQYYLAAMLTKKGGAEFLKIVKLALEPVNLGSPTVRMRTESICI